MSFLINPYVFATDTNSQGQQAFLCVGHSISVGTASGWGQPTPTAGTVYQSDGTTIREIGSDDINPSTGDPPGTRGSCWPACGIAYNASTGFKPCYIITGVGNSVFKADASATGGDWNPSNTNYTTMKTKALNTLTLLGVSKLKAIYVNLGCNDAAYSQSFANIASEMDTFLAQLIIDFPNTDIVFVQQGRVSGSVRDSLKSQQIKSKLKDLASNNTNVYIGGSMTAFETNGQLSADTLHPNIAGYTMLGEMIARWQLNTTYTKWARAIISAHNDNLSTARKNLINDFITTIGNTAYLNIDCLLRYKTSTAANWKVDWALLCNTLNSGAIFTANDSLDFTRATPTYVRTGFTPSFAQHHANGDSFVGGKIKANNLAAGVQSRLLGANDGSRTTTIYQSTSSEIVGAINGRVVIWTSGESGDLKLQNDTTYIVSEDGTNAYLHKNGTQVDSGSTTSGTVGILTVEIPNGAHYPNSATHVDGFDDTLLSFFAGKKSLVDFSVLTTALNTIDSNW